MKIRYALAAGLAVFGVQTSSASGPYPGLGSSSFSYVVSFPTGSTADFVDSNVSFRGLGLEWGAPLPEGRLYWGLSFRWLYFRDIQDEGTITRDNATATGRLYRSVDSFPIMLHLKYPLTQKLGRLLPFVGIGAGAIYGMRQLEIGTLSNNQYGWQVGLAPEAGTMFRISPSGVSQGFFNIRYDAGLGSDAIDPISNLSLAIGIATSF